MFKLDRNLAIIAATGAVLLAACSPDQRNGAGIARHLRELDSPIVIEVHYEAGTLLTDASIALVLAPGTNKAEADAFICDVALPYAESADPPDGLRIVALDGTTVIAADDSCR